VTRCKPIDFEVKPERNAIPARCGPPRRPLAPVSVADRIAAFLGGKTHGEDLLHELYDYVLDEPIPESMRELLQQGALADPSTAR
jgi:hypothetical protein